MTSHDGSTITRVRHEIIRTALRRRFHEVSERLKAARAQSGQIEIGGSVLPQVEGIGRDDQGGDLRRFPTGVPRKARRRTYRATKTLAGRRRLSVVHEIWMWSDSD